MVCFLYSDAQCETRMKGEEVWQGICKRKTLLLGWWIGAWLIPPPNFFVMSHYFFKRKNMLESSPPLPRAPKHRVHAEMCPTHVASLCPSPSALDGRGTAGPGYFLLGSSQPDPRISTLRSLLLCRAFGCLAELLPRAHSLFCQTNLKGC